MGNLIDFNNNPYLMKPLILNVQLRTQIKIVESFLWTPFNLVSVRLEYHYYLTHLFISLFSVVNLVNIFLYQTAVLLSCGFSFNTWLSLRNYIKEPQHHSRVYSIGKKVKQYMTDTNV